MARSRNRKRYNKNPGAYSPEQYLKGVDASVFYKDEQLETMLLDRGIPCEPQHVGRFRQLLGMARSGVDFTKKRIKPQPPSRIRRQHFLAYKEMLLKGTAPNMEEWIAALDVREQDAANIRQRIERYKSDPDVRLKLQYAPDQARMDAEFAQIMG